MKKLIKKLNIDNEALSNMKIENLSRDINLIPTEIVMTDKTPKTIYEANFTIFVIFRLTDGTHWVSVIGRDVDEAYYFGSSGIQE